MDEHERWDDLFGDLAGRFDAYDSIETHAQAAEHARAAIAEISVADRLRAADGAELVLVVRGAGALRGNVHGVGRDWLVLDQGGRTTLVLTHALVSVGGLGPAAQAAAPSAIGPRRGVAQPLRTFARDRVAVRVVLDTGDVVTGTIDCVGADHLDLAEHQPGEARRPSAVHGTRLVPFAAIATVSSGASL